MMEPGSNINDAANMEPTLDMSIYDFFIYLTKTKKIYIDINQFKE